MKIWSTPHGDMGTYVNYNGPKVDPLVRAQRLPLAEVIPQSEAGYLLETPSIRRYSFTVSYPVSRVTTWKVTIRPVRAISRKGRKKFSDPSYFDC